MPAVAVALAILVSLVAPAEFGYGDGEGEAHCIKNGGSIDCSALLMGWGGPGCPWVRYVPDGGADAQFELSTQIRDGWSGTCSRRCAAARRANTGGFRS